jgi:hypothetical protein
MYKLLSLLHFFIGYIRRFIKVRNRIIIILNYNRLAKNIQYDRKVFYW